MISILPGSQKSQKSEKGQGRELSKLKRQDLLELLLDQMHESDDLRAALAEQRAQILELTNLAERLKDKLDPMAHPCAASVTRGTLNSSS